MNEVGEEVEEGGGGVRRWTFKFYICFWNFLY